VANIKQQKKRNRRALAQRQENLRYRSTIKTLFKRLELGIADGEPKELDVQSRDLSRLIDRAAARGVIHPNNAARKKSRLARLVTGARTPEGAAS
jgi:small subunit ribosomal protein S20